MRLDSKIAVITGGGSGFGAGIAESFVAEGAKVVLGDVNLQAAKVVADRLDGLAVKGDVSKADDMAALVDAAMAAHGRIDIFINNAGTTHLPQPMEDVEEDEFDHVLMVNTKSVYLSARHVVPVMKRQESGVILNIASTAGVSPRAGLSWYNASKGWMITATKSMAVELAPHGIRVNALNPVAGETPMLKRFLGEDTPEMRAKFLATIPIGRFSTPQDLASAALFLCSDEASMITGIGMEIDGGRCI
jgi:3-oxoacyl-[acyl-carrier protein] reductase